MWAFALGRALVYNAPRVRDEVSLTTFWTTYGMYLWLGSLVAILALAGLVVRLTLQLRSAVRRYTTLTTGVQGETLDKIWDARASQVLRHDEQLEQLSRQLTDLRHSSVQHVGLVRFNPFGDVGGDQSFAVALLDGDHNGVILSSIFSRAGVRTYAKFVQAGASPSSLSDEEEAAIAQAVGGSLAAPAAPSTLKP